MQNHDCGIHLWPELQSLWHADRPDRVKPKIRIRRIRQESLLANEQYQVGSNWLTVTSINLTNFQTLCELIRARNCNLVPIGTAWSTGNSFGCCFVWFFRCAFNVAKLALIRPMGGASLYSATSYSRRPGVSSTTPDTRAPCGLKLNRSRSYKWIVRSI